MEIKQLLSTENINEHLLSKPSEEKVIDEKFEKFQELPIDLQGHVLTSISDSKTVLSLLSTCTQLYHDLTVWPKCHLQMILSFRFMCNSTRRCKELAGRISLALEKKEIGLPLPFIACGAYIDKLNPQIPARRLNFDSSPFTRRNAPFLPSHLQKLKNLPLVKELSIYKCNFTNFTFESPLTIDSITFLEIFNGTLSTEQAISLFNCFPNLTHFDIHTCPSVDAQEFIYKIEPRPLLKMVDLPFDGIGGKDCFRMLEIFPNAMIQEHEGCVIS